MRSVNEIIKYNDSAKGVVLCRASQPYEENGIVFLPFIEGIKYIFEMVD